FSGSNPLLPTACRLALFLRTAALFAAPLLPGALLLARAPLLACALAAAGLTPARFLTARLRAAAALALSARGRFRFLPALFRSPFRGGLLAPAFRGSFCRLFRFRWLLCFRRHGFYRLPGGR